MIRIAQRPFSQAVLDRLIQDRELLLALIQESLPPRFLGMFPQPSSGQAGHIVWLSEIPGQPRQFDALSERQARQVLETVEQRFAAIHAVILRRKADGALTQDQADRFRQILNSVPTQALLVVGDEPVVLYWNSALPESSAPLALLPLVPLVEPAPATVAPASASQGPGRRRSGAWAWWIAGLLALLLLLFLLWWWFCPLSCRNQPQPQLPPEPITHIVATEPDSDPEPDLALEPLPPEPEPEPPPPPPPEPEPAPRPEPKPEPKPKPAPKPVTITTAKDFCPEQRPPELVPQLVVVFDTSGSMKLNIGTLSHEEQQYYDAIWRMNSLSGIFGQQDTHYINHMEREPRRISVAKTAVSDLVRSLPRDMSVGLVTARTCPRADVRGFFDPGFRSALLGQIQGLQPEGGTPLADAISRAGDMLDGRGRESTILVVTDGVESCNGDPCAVARRLAASKPHLKINVVDIGSSGGGNCLAAATGGQVYTANSISSLKLGIDRATQNVQVPAHCK